MATFATTATGGLAADAASTIDVTFPSGTTFANYGGGGVFDGATRIGNCPTPDSGTRKTTCVIFGAIGPSKTARLEFNGVTNPTTPSGPEVAYRITVATSSDTTPTDSTAYTVAPANRIGNITVSISTPSNGASARTQYKASFATTATGGLSSLGTSTIDVTFPSGTTFANYGGGGVFDGTKRIGNCPTPDAGTRKTTCTIFDAIGPNTTARLEFNGITNPGAGTDNKLTVSTSSDPTPTDSLAYTIAPANRIGNITVLNGTPSNGAGARTQYVVTFSTTATGGLSSLGTSTLDVTFPSETTFANYGGGGVFDGSTRIGNCPTPDSGTRKTTCVIFGAIGANKTARLEFNGVTNPTTPSGPGVTHRITVSTSSDPTATDSLPYTVAAKNDLLNLTATPANSAPSVTTQYVVAFTSSPTGGLSSLGTSTIDVTFPGGTTFAAYTGGGAFDGFTRIGNCPTPNAATRRTTCDIFGAVGPNKTVRLELNGVTNPATAGSYHIDLSTSSDYTTKSSSDYSIAVDNTPPETTIDSGPPDTTRDTRPTFTFSAKEPGSSFECSVDDAPFTACTSPYTPPAALAPGEHTFQVRAKDPSANTDATPATRTFTITAPSQTTPAPTATPTPAAVPTPTPTPTPTPEPNKTVVIRPVSGKILVRRPGSKDFVELDATQGVPLGSTLDATDGVVALTSALKPGAQSQTSNFYAGIFKVTQSRSTTDLTLNEPLASCGRGAKAAARKKKTRRLWGDGAGAFRTRGQYSAATVRGTKWLVQDSCAGTLTKVVRGVVSVRDSVKRKTILVKAGRQYLAKPR